MAPNRLTPEHRRALNEGRDRARVQRRQRKLLADRIDESVLKLAVAMSNGLAKQADKGTFDPKSVDALTKLLDRINGKPRVAPPAADRTVEDTGSNLAEILDKMPIPDPEPSSDEDLPF